jgi:hypothetical protein
MNKPMLGKKLFDALIKSKTKAIPLSAEQELSLETHCATANLYGQSFAKIAVNEKGLMDITTITPNQWMSGGYAPSVTANGTQNTEKD